MPDKLYSDVIPRSAEYGGLVFCLAVMIAILLFAVWYLVKRNSALADLMLGVVKESVAAITEFNRKVDDVFRQKN